MTVNQVIRQEINEITTKLNAEFTEMGRTYTRIGPNSASFGHAKDRAYVLEARRKELTTVLEIVESNWVAERVAKAS